MSDLSEKGVYEVTPSMKENMKDFVGGFADQKENAEEIRRVFKDTGYLIDTHTGVASAVYRGYRQSSGDQTKTVIASTASPYQIFQKRDGGSLQPGSFGGETSRR